MSCLPARFLAQPLRQALVVWPEMRMQFFPESLGHWCTGTCVMPIEGNIAVPGQAEEIQYGLEGRLRIGPEHAGVHDVNPVPAKEPLKPVELVDVLTAGAVGVVLVAVAEIR